MVPFTYMEPTSSTTPLTDTSKLFCVTPLSKYLAMALFVAMPFLGGWVGYQYAPVQIIEVEVPIETDKGAETAAVTPPEGTMKPPTICTYTEDGMSATCVAEVAQPGVLVGSDSSASVVNADPAASTSTSQD
jgi:hypothetical protein